VTAAAFFVAALPFAQQAHAQTGLATSVVLAQWADETAYGGYDWSVAHNPGNVGSYDGEPVATFPTLQAGVDAYIWNINTPLYTAVRVAGNWQSQCVALGRSPWASSHYNASGNGPGSDLIRIVDDYNLTQYDAAPVTPKPSPPPQLEEDAMLMQGSGPAVYWLVNGKTVGLTEPEQELQLQALGVPKLPAGPQWDLIITELLAP
jgi:hypothetical protein